VEVPTVSYEYLFRLTGSSHPLNGGPRGYYRDNLPHTSQVTGYDPKLLNMVGSLPRQMDGEPYTPYLGFHHLVEKAIIIENKLKEIEKDGKCKMDFKGQHSGSNNKPHFSQPSQFVRGPFLNHAPMQHPIFQTQL
jgi:hypothetical protein